MSTDRELLEMAAKAAGLHHDGVGYASATGMPINWDPLEDDGDAARLAMQLCAAGKMRIQITEQSITCFYEQNGVFVPWSWGYETCTLSEAFCKCITGAAAEIGRNMP